MSIEWRLGFIGAGVMAETMVAGVDLPGERIRLLETVICIRFCLLSQISTGDTLRFSRPFWQ